MTGSSLFWPMQRKASPCRAARDGSSGSGLRRCSMRSPQRRSWTGKRLSCSANCRDNIRIRKGIRSRDGESISQDEGGEGRMATVRLNRLRPSGASGSYIEAMHAILAHAGWIDCTPSTLAGMTASCFRFTVNRRLTGNRRRRTIGWRSILSPGISSVSRPASMPAFPSRLRFRCTRSTPCRC